MKNHYIFKSPNNGHYPRYSTLLSNTVFTQEKVTEWLSAIPGVERSGAGIDNFCEILEEKKIEWTIFTCPCCEKLVGNIIALDLDNFIKKFELFGISWVMLEGISGNY